ncbi:MAG TPA: GNAT family N-acetyltransferase [Eoetvoesiella sp.]|jgi:predicted GNAT family N-acyltransferase|uniref:GNAT family N-acetyltransferase n=1 Tax=Eoetvoesiella sp. TaxID=1966355 RepID=UPI002CE0C037|nr:GNAT family N-acetyltransferase [Eoetvoesiella sp.]HWK62226.1 GNAT family N-acetyltransferase [Eoetvoesiella sp.]
MENYSIKLAGWDEIGRQAGAVRFEVFVNEQNVPLEEELDDEDARAIHVLASDGRGIAVGTGRLLGDGHIGRMAVLRPWRGRGVGSAMLLALVDEARRRGHGHAVLSAQCHARAFYAAHGFVAEGGTYMDAGIEHITMRRVL